MCGLLLAWPASAAVAQRQPAVTLSASARERVVVDSLMRAELQLQRRWWQSEEVRVHDVLRFPQGGEPGAQRLAMLHCHTDRKYSPLGGDVAGPMAYPLPTLIASGVPLTAMCPNWLPLPADDKTSSSWQHQEEGRNPALRVPFDEQVVARAERAWAQFPEEPFFLRQLVRMATENGQPTVATRALERCPAQWATLCGQLTGYVAYTSGDWKGAERTFRAVLPLLSADARCAWRSVESLLPPREAAEYTALPCAERDTLDATFWWLATPFLAEEVNLRLVEHLARQIRNDLVMELPLDAHHDLRREVGGTAIEVMRRRYGWPQHVFWAGAEQDKAHTHYQGAHNAPPFPSVEYWRSNSPTLPAWRVAQAPLTVADSDYAADPPTDVTAESWWPREFFLHPRGSVGRLANTQAVVLRRDTTALVMLAARLTGGLLDVLPAIDGQFFLMHSASPGVARELGSARGGRGDRVLLEGRVREAGVLSAELLLTGGGVAGLRSRLGITSDLLHPLAAGRCAVSTPMLLDASAVRRRGLVDVREGLLGSLRLVAPSKIGVAWESYGFRETDTVSVSLRISGVAAQTALQRAGRLFGLGDDPKVGLAITWREPSPEHVVLKVDAATPTLLRELTLDIHQLRAGAYEVEVAMERRGCGTVTSRRGFTIQ